MVPTDPTVNSLDNSSRSSALEEGSVLPLQKTTLILLSEDPSRNNLDQTLVDDSSFSKSQSALRSLGNSTKNIIFTRETNSDHLSNTDSSSQPYDSDISVNQITEPEIIIKKPVYQRKESILNLWKRLIYDVSQAEKYNQPVVTATGNYSMVVSLLAWSQLRKYELQNYPYNVQKAGKIFIHLPIYENNKCGHGYIDKSKCKSNPCGHVVPFSDIDTVVEMVNEYMDNGNGVLIHCHNNRNHALLFISCCMIRGNVPIAEVLDIMKQFDLRYSYRIYLRRYAEYLE